MQHLYGRPDRRRIYSFIQRRLIADFPYYFLWQAREIGVIPVRHARLRAVGDFTI